MRYSPALCPFRSPAIAALVSIALLPAAFAQNWTATATHALVLKDATELGPVDAAMPLHIVVGLKVQNPAQLQQTLQAMATPGNTQYGTSLTVTQFVSRFAPSAAQVQAVEEYLSIAGFTNVSAAPNNLIVEADGTAGAANAAFNTAITSFSQNGKTVFANTVDAQVPASLSATVLSILGLHNVALTIPPLPSANNTLNGYTPQDFQIAYNAAYPADAAGGEANRAKVATGSATAVGIVAEGDLTQVVNDLRLYAKANHLPEVPVTVVNAGMPSSDTSGADEWDLDSQTSTGIAGQVSHLYFYVATSLTDSDIGSAINKAVTSNQVKGFNMSFGECEILPYADGAMLLDDELFAEAALQGMTAFASSGDNGSACPVVATNGVPGSGLPLVAYPASSPYVIASGGTDLLTASDFSYSTETSWYSGGGISLVETSPFWQSYTGGGTAPIVPSAAAGQRGVPDVAMCADPDTCGALIYVDGATLVVGGTSLSSPLSLGSWARIESAHGNKLGFAGPLIYQLAASAKPTAVPPALPSSGPFNDVIVGANGAYTALPGWDYTTGLGSWNIYQVNKAIASTYPK
jgi:subtilase family serine protease